MNFFDLHCDTPYECYKRKEEFYANQLAVSGASGKVFKKWTQTFAVWIKDDADNPWQLYRNIFEDFKEKLKESPENLTPLFSVEGGALLEDDSDRLFALKNDGIRFLTLTWNGENDIAGGIKTDKGLTDFGKTVIKQMNMLKIGCDVSHLNKKSFFDVIELADHPLATHSNCFSLCDNSRNLTDLQIKLLAQKGGIIGLCFYPAFLGGLNVFEKIYENILHLLDMGLENHIAIGSDFDGAQMSPFLDKTEKVPELCLYLESKGLEKGLINKIFYKNAQNYIAKLE